MDAGNGVVITLGAFQDRAGADASTRMAADWVKDNLASSPTWPLCPACNGLTPRATMRHVVRRSVADRRARTSQKRAVPTAPAGETRPDTTCETSGPAGLSCPTGGAGAPPASTAA